MTAGVFTGKLKGDKNHLEV